MRAKMMNVFALLLVFTSLATAGFFNRNPDQKPTINEDHVAVKEAVVVEFDKDDGKTKVSISPQEEKLSGKMEEAKEKIKEETHHGHGFKARELVCDAYGKCKHKIASAMEKTVEKTKETVAETAHAAAEKVYAAEEEAKEAVSEAIGKVKDTVAHTARKASDKAQEMKESAKDAAGEVSSKAKNKIEREKGTFWCSSVCLVLGLVGGVVHLLGFAAAYGTGLWVTFASSYVLAGVLPRQQFAMVQSKMYPVYFRAMAYGIGTALLGHLTGLRRFSPLSMGMLQVFNLMAAEAMVLVNLMYFEPRATKVTLERMKKEKEEGQGKEAEAEVAGKAGQEKLEAGKFRVLQRLNSYSSLLNVATLMCLTWHLVDLGQTLHNIC